jgi:hypothetical protein
MRNNQIDGTLPLAWLDALPPQLRTLDLSDNLLGGPLPAANLLPDTLEKIELSQNQLEGEINQSWRLPASLKALVSMACRRAPPHASKQA